MMLRTLGHEDHQPFAVLGEGAAARAADDDGFVGLLLVQQPGERYGAETKIRPGFDFEELASVVVFFEPQQLL